MVWVGKSCHKDFVFEGIFFIKTKILDWRGAFYEMWKLKLLVMMIFIVQIILRKKYLTTTPIQDT